VVADKSSKVFLEDELKAIIGLVTRAMQREARTAEKQIKKMRS
jgi:hypothetical protein